MEPLIEVSKEANKRIKAREAEAEEQLNAVRRACEDDVATANREWGGYFDLHQEKIRFAVDQARACLEAAGVICAEYVFVAHAIEYRRVLRDSSKLEDELAALREGLIQQYGEHTRAAVQRKEGQQTEKASADWNTTPEVADESEAPVLVGEAPFWRARRNDFREYNSGETASLSAGWDSMADNWTCRGSDESQTVFKALATIAAKGFQSYDQAEPWRSWLNELRRRRRNYTEVGTSTGFSQRTMEDLSKFRFEPPIVKGELRIGSLDPNDIAESFGPDDAQKKERRFVQVRFEGVRGTIERVFETSANMCLDFEAESATPGGLLPVDTLRGEQNLTETRWYTLSRTGDPSGLRSAAFERLARRAIVELGYRFSQPSEALDAWIGLLLKRSEHPKRSKVESICSASAELCAELAVQSAEADNLNSEAVFRRLEQQFRDLVNSGPEICALKLEGPIEPFVRELLLPPRDEDRSLDTPEPEVQVLQGIRSKYTASQIAAAETAVNGNLEVDIRHAAIYLSCTMQHVRRLIRDKSLTASRTRPKRVKTASLRQYKWGSETQDQ